MAGSSNRWAVAGGMLATLLVPTAVVLGVLVGASEPDAPDAPPTAVLQSDAPSPAATATRSAARPTIDPADPLDAHQGMLEQMRVTVTPQMIQAMNTNPLVHSPGELAELERHAADLDRMLARNQ
jgi:hypothetical protein